MGRPQQRLRDPVTWALHAANHPHHSLADMFRDCQAEALAFGAEVGKQEFYRLAVDTDQRIRQRLSATSAGTTKT